MHKKLKILAFMKVVNTVPLPISLLWLRIFSVDPPIEVKKKGMFGDNMHTIEFLDESIYQKGC